MASDSPKAAHFECHLNGQRLHGRRELNLRWAIARKCKEQGVADMLRLSPQHIQTIEEVCADTAATSRHPGLTIRLCKIFQATVELMRGEVRGHKCTSS